MSRPRKPLDADRRATLMRHAREHFANRGFTGASLSEIVASAEFPRSSFYYFFGDKAALFDAAFSDGLSRLAERLSLPDPEALTEDAFWPTIFSFAESLGAAGQDRDLATLATLFHLPDAPPSAARVDFERAAQKWCTAMVRVGRSLGQLDQTLPEDLQAELAWSIAVVLDRWVATHANAAQEGAQLTNLLLMRLFGTTRSGER